MHTREFLRTKMSGETSPLLVPGRIGRRPLQKRARQSMNRPTIIELSSEANASARRMWNKLTTVERDTPVISHEKKGEREREKTTLPRRACTVILISYAPRVFPLFPRNTAMPAIILTRTRVRYELSAVARSVFGYRGSSRVLQK